MTNKLAGIRYFHVVDKEMLEEVGEWAKCQDVGVFVYLTNDEYYTWKKMVRTII